MSDKTDTDQLRLWRGDFGRAYIERNEAGESTIEMLVPMWKRMLVHALPAPQRILEVGCNIGINLRALRRITDAELHGVEPNAIARERLIADNVVLASHIRDAIAANLPFADRAFDLAFTVGVMIHINPDQLAESCREIHRVTSRFVLCAEYYAAEPREILYRGHRGQLFLRDYGAFWRATCPDLALVDYGFFWTGAGATDNLTWWLFARGE